MNANSSGTLGKILGWVSIALFAIFGGNVIAAKLGSTMEVSLPLLPVLGEFYLLLAATGFFVGYALSRERKNGNDGGTEEIERFPDGLE